MRKNSSIKTDADAIERHFDLALILDGEDELITPIWDGTQYVGGVIPKSETYSVPHLKNEPSDNDHRR